jgi:hypothetical protein
VGSDNGNRNTGGANLLGVVLAAIVVAVFAHLLIGDRLGLCDTVSDADVRVESARVLVELPRDELRHRK